MQASGLVDSSGMQVAAHDGVALPYTQRMRHSAPAAATA